MTNSSYAHQSLPGTSKTIGNTMTAPRQPHSGTVMLADLDPNKQVTKQNRPYSIVQSLHTSKAHGDTMTMPRLPFSNTAEFASCQPSKLEEATKIQPYSHVYCQPAIPPVITGKPQSLKRFQQIPPYSIVQSPHTSKALGNTMTVPRQPHSSTVMQADLDPNKQLTKQNRPYSIVQSLHTSKAHGDTMTMPRLPFSNTAEFASCQPSKLEEVTKIQPYSNVYCQPAIPPVITGKAQSLKRFQFDGDAKENLPNQCKEKQPITQITNDVPILPHMLPGSNSTTKPSWLPASRLQNRTKRIHNLIRKRTHYGDRANGESSDSLRTKEQTILEVSQQPPNQSQNTSKQMKLSPIAIVSKKSIQNVHASVSGSQASIVPNPEHQLMVASHQEKRIRYAGDIKDLSIITPDAAKQALPRVLHQLHESQKRVNRLKQQNMRLRRNTNRFAEIMAELRAKQIITAGGEVILQKFSSNSELLEELNNIRRGLPFSEAVRSFATTLNFYSSKAYRFVRKAFDNTLPHERTVASWYRTVDGEPGITVESLNVLKKMKVKLATQTLSKSVADAIKVLERHDPAFSESNATIELAAYKRLLTHHNITAPPKANCTEFGDTTMLSVLMGPYRHEHNSGTTEPNLGQSFDGTSEEVLIMGEAVNHDTTNSRLTRSLEDTKHNLMNDMLEDDFMDEDIKDAAEQQTI
ncbi:uncharacterized protein LOC134221494 [Armigeres subalbatus]|uniref:uncharacterized protein LOC134221494 n=1 Tax=Armigeres subalbatus TaxID=124917 RepID=UPI002ED47B3B